MLLASAWIVVGSLKILSGERELGTPIGLAAAAVVAWSISISMWWPGTASAGFRASVSPDHERAADVALDQAPASIIISVI